MERTVDTVTVLLVVSRALEALHSVVVLLQPPSDGTYQLGVLSEYDLSGSELSLPSGLGLGRVNDEHGFTVGMADAAPIVTVSHIFEVEGGYTVPRLGILQPKTLYPIVRTLVLNVVFDAPQEQCVQTLVKETSTSNNGADIQYSRS